jgi:hypothetical protein
LINDFEILFINLLTFTVKLLILLLKEEEKEEEEEDNKQQPK